MWRRGDCAQGSEQRHHPRQAEQKTQLTVDIPQRADVALRLGKVFDSSHRAVQLSTFEILPVASPAFIASLASINRVQALKHGPISLTRPKPGSGLTTPPCCKPLR